MTTFTRKASTFSASDETFSSPVTSTITGNAIQVRGKADRYRELGLSLSTEPTLFFTPTTYPLAANGSEFVLPGDTVSWASKTYTVKDVDPIAPDGYVIAARIIVGAG
jgi:hypothetical protein